MKPAREVRVHAAPVVRRGTAWFWAGSAALFGSAVVLAGLVFIPGSNAADVIDGAIKEIGFQPVKPANRLRGPGSIYVVQDDSFYHQVCPVHPADLDGIVQTSPAQAHVRERLQKGKFEWDADLVSLLNANLGGSRVTSIKYSLSNVTMHEVPDAALKALQRKLMADRDCEDVVVAYFNQHKKICSGYAALSASATFKIDTEKGGDVNLKLVKDHLEQQTGAQIDIVSNDEFSGENLFYGIRLSEIICAIPDDDRLNRLAQPKV